MTPEDYVFMGCLAVLSASVAYAVGRRRAPSEPQRPITPPIPTSPLVQAMPRTAAPPMRSGPMGHASSPPVAPSSGRAMAMQPQSQPQARARATEPARAGMVPPQGRPGQTPSVRPATPAPAAATPSASRTRPSRQPAPPPAPPKPRPPSEPSVDRLFEEDESVDPTKVGTTAALGLPIPTRTIYQPPLKCITYDEDADHDEPTLSQSMFLIHATAQTDTGLRRKRNEDSVLALEEENVFVIADGMGGHKGGHLASQTAVGTIAASFRQQDFEGPAHDNVPLDVTNLARAIQMANAAILELATKNPDLEGMGTTVCAARFSPNKRRLFIGHVGDSRCYSMRSGVLRQMTADHTMADYGVTGPESAQLSRAVGIWPTVPIDIISAAPSPGDSYLLCSDGLTKMLSDDAISHILQAHDDPKTAVEQLIIQANARGGKDNITVILVKVVPPNWTPSPSAVSPASPPPSPAS